MILIIHKKFHVNDFITLYCNQNFWIPLLRAPPACGAFVIHACMCMFAFVHHV